MNRRSIAGSVSAAVVALLVGTLSWAHHDGSSPRHAPVHAPAHTSEAASGKNAEPEPSSPCVVASNYSVVEAECQSTVAVSTVVECPQPWLAIVFVVPARGMNSRWISKASLDVLDTAEESGYPVVAGVIESGFDPVRRVEITPDLENVRQALMRLSAGGQEFTSAGLEHGLEMLEAERDERGIAAEAVVIFGTYKPSKEARAAREFGRARRLLDDFDGWVGVGCEADRGYLCDLTRDLARDRDRSAYAEAPHWLNAPTSLEEWLQDQAANRPAAALGVTHRIPAVRQVDPTSIDPAAAVAIDATDQIILWSFDPLTESTAVTYTLAAGPPISITTTALVTDTLGLTSVTTDTLTIDSVDPCVTPSATPIVPSATPTPPPSATPRPPTPTRMPQPAYLPIALFEAPCRDIQPLDVALVLDTSSSMGQEEPTKLSRAIGAMRVFVDALHSEDQIALVTFDAQARPLVPLTRDKTDFFAALESVQIGETTRIDLGISTALRELSGPRADGANRPVMILLTDGKPNPVGPSEVLAQADQVHQAGVSVIAIGLGENVDHELMRNVASQPDLYFEAPTADDLESIYRGLLHQVPCDPGAYWGKR